LGKLVRMEIVQDPETGEMVAREPQPARLLSPEDEVWLFRIFTELVFYLLLFIAIMLGKDPGPIEERWDKRRDVWPRN
jgi:hypothetical protein